MAFTPLAPSLEDRNVSTKVPKVKDPYFIEFFDDTKLNGQSVNDFVLDKLMELSMNHQIQKQIILNLTSTRQMQLDIANDLKFIVE